MRKITVMVAMFCTLVASIAIAADDVFVDVVNNINNTANATGGAANQDQNQGQDQRQHQDQAQNITTPGTMPVAVSHGVALPSTMPRTGNMVTQTSAQAFMGPCEDFTFADFEVVVNTMKESGMESWKSVNNRIQPYPFLKKTYPALRKDDPVFFIDAKMLKQIDPINAKVLGGFVYNSKFKKDKPVLPMYYNPRAYLDASKYGANVVVFSEQYFQGYSTPVGWGVDVAAVISQISSGFTHGSSLAGGLGVAGGSNTETGRTGMAYVFMRIEGFNLDYCYEQEEEEVVYIAPPVPVTVVQPPQVCDPTIYIDRIYNLEFNEIRWCKFPGQNNQALRFEKGNAKLDQFYCEGGKNTQLLIDAISEFGIGERDFNNGVELAPGQKFGEKPNGVLTPTVPAARELMYKIAYNKALAIRELNGERAEIAHAQFYGLGQYGSMDMPTVWADMKR